MRIRLGGKQWRVRFERIDGLCEHPPYRQISVDHRLKGRQRLEVIIHEALHACLPQLSEKEVTTAAADHARLLWNLGYRTEDA